LGREATITVERAVYPYLGEGRTIEDVEKARKPEAALFNKNLAGGLLAAAVSKEKITLDLVYSQDDPLAARACWQVLDQQQLLVDDLDLIICSTTSPTSVTPSMACQVLNALSQRRNENMLQAYDINAACSGYLYALQSGYDYLQSTHDGRVLIVTAEVLSPLLNPKDFDTSILFGDATSATILYGESHFDRATARMFRPELSAKAEDGTTLSVPLANDGYIQMKGRRVFTEAVRSMIASLTRACERQGMMVEDLNMVVPHQANQRILDAIASRIGVEVFSNIRCYGNTSSTSIPLCLSEVLPRLESGNRIGLCAFGGGFTFGAGILQKCS
jgi:2-oxoisovalerate dehydrogenase E1 component